MSYAGPWLRFAIGQSEEHVADDLLRREERVIYTKRESAIWGKIDSFHCCRRYRLSARQTSLKDTKTGSFMASELLEQGREKHVILRDRLFWPFISGGLAWSSAKGLEKGLFIIMACMACLTLARGIDLWDNFSTVAHVATMAA